MFSVPEKYRLKTGAMGSDESSGNNGVFIVKTLKLKNVLNVIVSDGTGCPETFDWEHVSVTVAGAHRCPTWEEMCFVKDLFWGDDDFVVQMHPPKSENISYHPYCLHLWRKMGTNDFCERPNSLMVGLGS